MAIGIVHQMQDDPRAAPRRDRRGRHGNRKIAFAVRRPQPRRIRAGTPGNNLDPLGHHESRIETDAEAANERVTVSGSGPAISLFAGLGWGDTIEKGLGA